MAYPKSYRYTKEHEWIEVKGDLATIGITDHAQHALGDIVFVELPKVGTDARATKAVGVVESVKAASDVYSPLTGKIVSVNNALAGAPESINSDCYGAGWMVKIEIGSPAELDSLLDADGYAEFLKTL